MPLDSSDLSVIRDLVARAVREGIRNAATGGAIGVPRLRAATVLSFSADYSTCQVLVDGDVSAISAATLANAPLLIGTRVVVLFDPPQGVYVLGPFGISPGGWTRISTQVVETTGSLLSFEQIPQAFTDLRIVVQARGNAAVAASSGLFRLNSDASAIYDRVSNFGDGFTASSGLVGGDTQGVFANMIGTSGTANKAGAAELLIPNYSGTTFEKNILTVGGYYDHTVGVSVATFVNHWRSTAAINRIDLFFNAAGTGWVAGSLATLDAR